MYCYLSIFSGEYSQDKGVKFIFVPQSRPNQLSPLIYYSE